MTPPDADGAQSDGQMPGGFSGGNWGEGMSSEETTDETTGDVFGQFPEDGSQMFPGISGENGDGSGVQMPENREDMMSMFPDGNGSGITEQGGESWVLVGISVLVLLLGLIIAFKFKH